MQLKIITPKGILCCKEIDKACFPGEVGPFEVLKNHAPLISNLEKGIITYQENGKKVELAIEGGFVKVNNNLIEVCVEKYEKKS